MKNNKYSKLCIKEKECPASWQVKSEGNTAFIIQCRICKVVLSSGGVPKCLLDKDKL